MDEDKTILNFAIHRELLTRLEDFRFNNRIKSNSEAIRRLLDEALKKYEKQEKKPKK
jgi:metal-responsive CopG/Arc/MetJ family transcriptional regulator